MNDTPSSPDRRLAVVLSNPPTTCGLRTLQRVELARETLGYASVVAVNLFSISTYRTGGISAEGAVEAGWLDARPELLDVLSSADAVVLGYGCQEPSGPARLHFREQLAWLQEEIGNHNLPTWMLDGRPRHPSRWHRHTHASYPDLPFAEALVLALRPVKDRIRPLDGGSKNAVERESD
ncbi:uncharacterized protein DUF1643 [Rhodoglobus vestalii]|uniref:Uncharacterized protein DUF1643 n=1 Tax=Rhodoglobus vestalii TaxID=193384 RepID=A0A8H2PUP8_9MICO|nr:DUF1643 domain-containing protein [Rhodoglobus vestalii]TQO19927.1 uncharacterized protein DUF1643 [Rhodoglobus vestalii]